MISLTVPQINDLSIHFCLLNNFQIFHIINKYLRQIMEELQSTEILDREILEDARKKAQRILKTADETIRAQTSEWEKKTVESIGELEKKYREQKEAEVEKVMARLPIDKLRSKVEKIDSMLQSAVEAWYGSLNRSRIIELLTGEFAKRIDSCEEFSSDNGQKKSTAKTSQIRALYSGLSQKEAETTLKVVGWPCVMEEKTSVNNYPSIVLETGDVRITASIQETVNFLLQEKRAELVDALLGRGFLEE